MITPINSMTIEQITERQNDLLVSSEDIKEISRVAKVETIELCMNRFAEWFGYNYQNQSYYKQLEQLKKGSAGDGKTM